MARKQITERITHLDPKKDCQEIMFLLTCHVFPWDIERALEFALFRTYAIPAISSLIVKTGEFQKHPHKRYDDTQLLLAEITENGYDSDRGKKALNRMNQMHGRFPISNDDFLYILSTLIYEPIRWIEKYSWRSLKRNEQLACFYFYREMGHRMYIRDIPESYEEFEQFNRNYEEQNFVLASSNPVIAKVTVNLFLSFYLPRLFWSLGKPLIYAAIDNHLLEVLDLHSPPKFLRESITGLLKLRGKFAGLLQEPSNPILLTARKRPTYPNGYNLEELGTFTHAKRSN
jgi:hypothetical protein